MDWRDRVVTTPNILVGKPVIEGTRISVELILGWLLPAILYLRQEPCPADRPADLVLAMLSEPTLAEGFLVVISEGGVRRKRVPGAAGE